MNIICRNIYSLAFGVCIVATFNQTALASEPKKFDLDGNGELNKQERSAYFLHRVSSAYRNIDKNKNGDLEETEIEEHKVLARQKASRDIFDANILIPGFNDAADITPDEISRVFEDPKPQVIGKKEKKLENDRGIIQFGGLLVRAAHEDVSVLNKATDFKRAKSATFSYTRDFENTGDIAAAKAAFIYPIQAIYSVSPSSENFVLSRFTVSPSISIDYLGDSVSQNNSRDSLAFRLGGEFEFAGGKFDAQYYRFNGVYNTDTDLNTGLVAGEFQWEPVIGNYGIGTAKEIIEGNLAYRLRTIAHIEAGTVNDAGTKENLFSDQSFVRAGPQFELNFWAPEPSALSNFTATISYHFFAGLNSDSEDSYEFSAGLNYLLNDAGNLSVGLGYRKGKIPLVLDETDEIRLSLEAKF